MPRTEQKAAVFLEEAAGSTPGDGLELEETSGVKSTSDFGFPRMPSPAGRRTPPPQRMGVDRAARSGLADEAERTRLIADLARLMNDPCIPETTRVAGLTLIGWLARRRLDEMPHGLGIERARKSAGRTKACRSRAR